MENDKKYSQAQRKGQRYILLAFRCLVSTNTILAETRGKIIQLNWRLFEWPETLETVVTANGEVQTIENHMLF